MIVRSVDQGWTIVFQTSHGLLAQRIASCLNDARALPYWFETQVAIGLHDDLHQRYKKGEHEQLTQAGAPRDFSLVPIQDRKRADEMRKRIDEAFRKHSWLGVMQSKHADCLYRGEDTTADMQQMLDAEAQRREAALTRLEIMTDHGGTRFEIWQDDTDCIRVAPWPFVDEIVELSIEYRTVKQLSYADDEELGTALKACPVGIRTLAMRSA